MDIWKGGHDIHEHDYSNRDTFPIPEMLLNEVRVRFGLQFRLFPGGSGYTGGRSKSTAAGPKIDQKSGLPHSFWHSHNVTAVNAWVTKYNDEHGAALIDRPR